MTTLTHRRHEAELADGWITLFAVDGDNDNYGHHVWTLRSELPYITEVDGLFELVRTYAEDTYDETWDDETVIAHIDPERIVGNAGLWDSPEFVGYVQSFFRSVNARTRDGAIVMDRETVELEYSLEQ